MCLANRNPFAVSHCDHITGRILRIIYRGTVPFIKEPFISSSILITSGSSRFQNLQNSQSPATRQPTSSFFLVILKDNSPQLRISQQLIACLIYARPWIQYPAQERKGDRSGERQGQQRRKEGDFRKCQECLLRFRQLTSTAQDLFQFPLPQTG